MDLKQHQDDLVAHEAEVEREAIKAIIKESITAHDEHHKSYMTEGWEPHPWVMEAMGVLYRKSEQARREASAEKDFVLEQMAEQHEKDQDGLVHATVAAVLEAVLHGHYNICGFATSADVTILMEAQRTIWDRAVCKPAMSEDGKVITWTYTQK